MGSLQEYQATADINLPQQEQDDEDQLAGRDIFRILVDNSPYPVILVKSSGKISYVSPRFTDLFGWSSEDLPDLEAFHEKLFPDPGHRRQMRLMLERWLAGEGQTLQSEHSLVCKDGIRKQVMSNAIRIPGDGFFLVKQDITERKKAEQEMLLREKLQAAVETAGAACHEFTQPLQALMAQVELTLMALEEPNPLRGDLEQMLSQVWRLREIVHRLQRITRYRTKDYLGELRILDLDQASA